MNSKELTWTCHICKAERPDYYINVYQRQRKINGVPFTQNIRYCSENPECLEGAKLFPSPTDGIRSPTLRGGESPEDVPFDESEREMYLDRIDELKRENERLKLRIDYFQGNLANAEKMVDALQETYVKPAYGIEAYERMGVAWRMFWRSFRDWFRG